MSTLIATISNTKVKIRWQETYVSEGLNKAMSAFGKGIVHGFQLAVQSAQTIRLRKNTPFNQSVAAFFDVAQGLCLMYVEPNHLDLDLSPFAGTTVILGLTVTYTVGGGTTAEIRAYTEAEYAGAPTAALWLGLVRVPSGVTPIAITDIDAFPRDEVWMSKTDQASEGWGQSDPDPWVFDGRFWLASATTGNAVANIQSATVNNGPNAMRFRLSGGATPGDAYRIMRSMIRVVQNDVVRVIFDARPVGLTATQRGVAVKWFSAAGALLSTSYITPSTLTGTGAWSTYSGIVRAPANAFTAQVWAGVTNLSAGDLYLDSLRVFAPNQSKWGNGATPYAQSIAADQVILPNLKDLTKQMEIRWDDTTATTFHLYPTAAGAYDWQIGGGTRIINTTLKGDLTVNGNETVNGDVVVNGNHTLNGDQTINGELVVTGAMFSVDVSGNVVAAGTVTADKFLFNTPRTKITRIMATEFWVWAPTTIVLTQTIWESNPSPAGGVASFALADPSGTGDPQWPTLSFTANNRGRIFFKLDDGETLDHFILKMNNATYDWTWRLLQLSESDGDFSVIDSGNVNAATTLIGVNLRGVTINLASPITPTSHDLYLLELTNDLASTRSIYWLDIYKTVDGYSDAVGIDNP